MWVATVLTPLSLAFWVCCFSWQLGERAVALSLLPFSFFFWFLFYTDPGSVFFVLASYSASLRGE